MTGTRHIAGPGAGGMFGQIGRWLTLAAATITGLFLLFFSAAFALILIGGIALVALIAVAVFWVRAKLTGRPFGPRAVMEARMAELRSQMGAQMGASAMPGGMPGGMSGGFASPFSTPADNGGPTIDAQQTPEGWTVER